jgi:hypothetical protein
MPVRRDVGTLWSKRSLIAGILPCRNRFGAPLTRRADTQLPNGIGCCGGLEPYERLLEYRKVRTANTVGEPKLAAAFLRELT